MDGATDAKTQPVRLDVRTLLTHARHDPATCLAPGLFRALKKGDRKKLKLDITYRHGDALFRFVGFEPLGADDLRVLQTLVAMAGPHGAVLAPEPATRVGAALRKALECTGIAAAADAVSVTTSGRALLAESGMAGHGGSDIDGVRASLLRLGNVTLHASRADGEREGTTHLLSFERDVDSITVALNYKLAGAIVGDARQHVRIPMDEVRALRGDVARLIHQRLCAWVDPGRTRHVMLETLVGYAYPSAPICGANEAPRGPSPSTKSMRRAKAKAAVAELRGLGWTIETAGPESLAITRPRGERAARDNAEWPA